MTEQQFDVFLAHNSKDKPLIRQVYYKLTDLGIRPWLDEKEIAPGTSFQDEIQQAIRHIKTVAIFIGQDGLGCWQALELKSFINQCVRRDIPVIPVLLPGVEEIPEELIFLQEFHAVLFRDNINDENALSFLVWGITGVRPKEPMHFDHEDGFQNSPHKKENLESSLESQFEINLLRNNFSDLGQVVQGFSESDIQTPDSSIETPLEYQGKKRAGIHPRLIVFFTFPLIISLVSLALLKPLSLFFSAPNNEKSAPSSSTIESGVIPSLSFELQDPIFPALTEQNPTLPALTEQNPTLPTLTEEEALAVAEGYLEAKKVFFAQIYYPEEADRLIDELFNSDSPLKKAINDIIWEENQNKRYIRYYEQQIADHRSFLPWPGEGSIEVKIREAFALCYRENDRPANKDFPRQDTNWYKLSVRYEDEKWKLYDIEIIEKMNELDRTPQNSQEYNVNFCSDLA